MVLCVVTFSVSLGIYHYSNVRVGLEEKAKTTMGVVDDAIKAAGEKLQEASHKLAEVVYSNTQEQTAGGNAGASNAGSGSADDVVDADYEVVDDDKKKD